MKKPYAQLFEAAAHASACTLENDITNQLDAAIAAVESIPSLRPFDDDESELFPGASNLPGNLPPEIAYVTLDSHNGPGAIEVDCTVILAGYDSENPYTVSVYDDSPDLVAVVGFRSKDDAVAFANFILYGSITVDGVRGFGCSV